MVERGPGKWGRSDKGQVMVEFVLVAPLLFFVVGGIIQFALALNYWLDMQRIANQGARWAVVSRYPLPDGSMCPGSSQCSKAPEDPGSLQVALREQAQSDGLRPAIEICFPTGTGAPGNPVRVRLESDFTFVPILGIGTVTLGADAEMRIEQPPAVYQASACHESESPPEPPPPPPPPPSPPAPLPGIP